MMWGVAAIAAAWFSGARDGRVDFAPREQGRRRVEADGGAVENRAEFRQRQTSATLRIRPPPPLLPARARIFHALHDVAPQNGGTQWRGATSCASREGVMARVCRQLATRSVVSCVGGQSPNGGGQSPKSSSRVCVGVFMTGSPSGFGGNSQ